MSDLPRYLQLMWGREGEGRRGPRPGRTIEQIGLAGIEIADREGLGAVSMKAVAGAIGLTTMSLYRYVDSKDELVAVMTDLAYGEPDVSYAGDSEAGRASWRDRLTSWVEAVTARRMAHPWTVDALPTTPPLTPRILAWTEAGLAALDGTALRQSERFSVLLAVDGWSYQHLRQSISMGLLGVPQPGSIPADYERLIAELVDPAVFPMLSAAATDQIDNPAGEEFFAGEFARGLTILLDGIEALMIRAKAESQGRSR